MGAAEVIFASLDKLVPFARLRAARMIYNGQVTPENQKLIGRCTHELRIDMERAAMVIFTRDTGHHTSRWWKNPDYERCFHLSISFHLMAKSWVKTGFDKVNGEKIARAFYGDGARWTWLEPPYTPQGRAADVWHYRLFADPSWTPMKPAGEVYSREDTPADWKSFSEIHGYTPAPDQAPFLLAASESAQ